MGLVPIFCFRLLRTKRSRGLLKSAARDGRFSALRDPDDRWTMTGEELSQLLAPAIAALGLELVGVEFSPNSAGSLLRVYIDEPERGVTIDDCERASREVSALLDVNDPVAGRYTLEVSSPGLERPLFSPAQFARFLGEKAKVNVSLPIDGRRRFQGPITAVDGDRITIEQDGIPVAIVHANIARAQLVPDYAALGLAAARSEEAGAAGRAPRRRAGKS
jgi:ribosome maturation factor RimP